MGAGDKVGYEAEMLAGKAKEATGKLTHNDKLIAEGKAEQAKAAAKEAAEKAKDATKAAGEHVKDKFEK